jgi:hypothetical protein
MLKKNSMKITMWGLGSVLFEYLKKKLSTGFELTTIFSFECFNRHTAGTQKDTLLE